jgi:hypothetical protein
LIANKIYKCHIETDCRINSGNCCFVFVGCNKANNNNNNNNNNNYIIPENGSLKVWQGQSERENITN